MGRPATGKTPVQHIRIPGEDWDEFNEDGRGATLVRDLLRWWLRVPARNCRPGLPLPLGAAEPLTAIPIASPPRFRPHGSPNTPVTWFPVRDCSSVRVVNICFPQMVVPAVASCPRGLRRGRGPGP